MDLVLLEHGRQFVVANDLPLVTRVLQFVLFDVVPNPFDNLWSRELWLVSSWLAVTYQCARAHLPGFHW